MSLFQQLTTNPQQTLGGNLAIAISEQYQKLTQISLPTILLDSHFAHSALNQQELNTGSHPDWLAQLGNSQQDVHHQSVNDPFLFKRVELLGTYRPQKAIEKGLYIRALSNKLAESFDVFDLDQVFENRVTTEIDAGHYDLVASQFADEVAMAINVYIHSNLLINHPQSKTDEATS